MPWWPNVEIPGGAVRHTIWPNAAAFSRHVVFASQEHAYCAALAAELDAGGWRIDESPDGSGRCVLSILDDGADWKGLFCWDKQERILIWLSHIWARKEGSGEEGRLRSLQELREEWEHSDLFQHVAEEVLCLRS